MARIHKKEDAGDRERHYSLPLLQIASAITQDLWRTPAEEVCSFQAVILQEHLHRFFRGRDSMQENERNRRFTFWLQYPISSRVSH
jgi:hypothetical protein